MEPMLDASQAVKLFFMLVPHINDSIWLGKMNRARTCLWNRTEEEETAIHRVEAGQTDERIWAIYETLKDEPKVRWKDSIKKVLGLQLAEIAGMDR